MRYRSEDLIGKHILFSCALTQHEIKATVEKVVEDNILQVRVDGNVEGVHRYITLGQIKEVYDKQHTET